MFSWKVTTWQSTASIIIKDRKAHTRGMGGGQARLSEHQCQELPATLIHQVGLAPQAPIVQWNYYVLSLFKGTRKSSYPQSHRLCLHLCL